MSGAYLAAWAIWRLAGKVAAEEALAYVAPVGEEDQFKQRALGTVSEFIEAASERRDSV